MATKPRSVARPTYASTGANGSQTRTTSQRAAHLFPPSGLPVDANFIYLPLLVIQADSAEDEFRPSEVELLHMALMHYRKFVASGPGTASAQANQETLDELIQELRTRSFGALSHLASFINQFDR